MNATEKFVFEDLLSSQSYWVGGPHGWPDFMVYDEDADFLFTVEVKLNNDPVRENQLATHRLLEKIGIPVIVVRVNDADITAHIKQFYSDLRAAYRRYRKPAINKP